MTNTATPVFSSEKRERSPGAKLLLALLVGFVLSIPLLAVYALNYDRQNQSQTAMNSIAQGWGGPQTIAGPLLVIPYQAKTTETVEEGGKQVVKSSTVWRELVLSPEVATLETVIKPTPRKRSIYEAIVYEANLKGQAKFVMPSDLERIGVPASDLVMSRAEIRFGLSDARGLFGRPPTVRVGGNTLKLEPGHGPGATNGSGFFTWFDASALPKGPIIADFDYDFRGNGSLTLAPRAGDTSWKITSKWPNPSFTGGFLPVSRDVKPSGFTANYRVGNLALGQSLVNADDPPVSNGDAAIAIDSSSVARAGGASMSSPVAAIDLIQPVDLYDQVSRATKYGFLFIGFTFLAFLMFDIIGGVRVSAVEYLLVGAGLVLFFVLLLAFAEVVGFTWAYLIASIGIIGLITAYSSAILKSRRRSLYIGGLLTALYAVLYILLSLEAYALLIGSLMLFVALAGVMYATRRIDWGAARQLAEG